MERQKQAVLLGLDGLDYVLVGQWCEDLPNLKTVMHSGLYGSLEGTIPPATHSVWPCLILGENPGQLGIWDQRFRASYSYNEPQLVTSRVIEERGQPFFNIIANSRKKTAVVNIPSLSPALEVPNGYCIAEIVGQKLKNPLAYPPSIQEEIDKSIVCNLGQNPITLDNLGRMNVDDAIQLIRNTDRHVSDLTKYFIVEKQCDFVFAVLPGIDILVNWILSACNHQQKKRETEDARRILFEHYRFHDEIVGEIFELVKANGVMFILSPYAAQPLKGTINLNEWLIQQGYLAMRNKPNLPVPVAEADIDWNRSQAWSAGSFGAIYLNIKGREPEGVVEPRSYDGLCEEIAEKLCLLRAENGNPLDAIVYKRIDVHQGRYSRFGPDIMVGFSNWQINTCENIGCDSIYSCTRDEIGGGIHNPTGFLAVGGAGISGIGKIRGATTLDVAPTVLKLLDLPVPQDMEGNALVVAEGTSSGTEEDAIKKRLSQLGYLG